MPYSSSPNEQDRKNNGEKGTQTDPTVRENLTFKYLEACCEGECPQKDCSDTDCSEKPLENSPNSCPGEGAVISLDKPCGESPPCAATTDKCLAYAQPVQGDPSREQTPYGDQGAQPQPTPEDESPCTKGDCPGYQIEPGPSGTGPTGTGPSGTGPFGTGPSGKPLSPIPSSAGGERPPSRDGCPKVPCPSNNPDGEYICRPTPCPGAGLQPSPSQGGMSGRSGGPMATGGPPMGRSDASMGVDCKKQLCPAVQAALEAAYGTGAPCPAGPGVCGPNIAGSQQVLQPGGQPSAMSGSQPRQLSPQRSGISGPMGSGYPSAAQMGPEGSRALSPQRSGMSGHPSAAQGPGGQMSPSAYPSAMSAPGGPYGQMSTGPSGQIVPGSSGQIGRGPSGQMGPCSSGQIGRGPSGQMGPCSSGQVGRGPSGQIGPGPSGQIYPGPSGQISPGPSGQIGPGGQTSQHPSAMSGMRADGQVSRQPSGQPGMSAQGPAGMAGQGGFGSKCPADQGLWPQYHRKQPINKCTGMDTCPRKNPALLGPLSPLAQMYLDMSKPKHDWGKDPFKPGDVVESTQTYSSRPGSRGREEYGRNRITLSFAKNLHPVIDVSLTEADAGYDDGDDKGGNLDTCAKQNCCKICK